MDAQLHLAGDIGGTKTILALFSFDKGPLQPVYEKSYTSSAYPGLDAIITDFFDHTGISTSTACFGVAGPVRNGRAVITTLPWQPDSSKLQDSHGFTKATLINDLVATGYAIPHLPPSDFMTINKGKPVSDGGLGIIAPGTGLGEVIFIWDGGQYLAVPSEGGHADFGPGSEIENLLLVFMKDRYGHVSYDRICSGRGIPAIYDFLKTQGSFEVPAWLNQQISGAEDPAPVITDAALDNTRKSDICRETLRLFTSVLGAEAGNLALKGLTTGGIFIGGGIPPRILPFLKQETFMDAFTSKGRMSYLMHDIPVKIILNSKAALTGAAAYVLGLRFTAAPE